MGRFKTEKYTLIASLLVHGILMAMFVYEASQPLVLSAVKGSQPSSFGGVSIAIVEKPKAPRVKQTPKAYEGPSEVLIKKPVKAKPSPKKQAKAKVAKKPKQKKNKVAEPKDILVENRGGTGAPSVIGFDLENIKGNVSPRIQKYFNSLRADIQRRHRYPRVAKRLRQTGKVIVKFEINKDGTILNVFVKEPSPHSTLNHSAKKLISNLSGPYPLPDDLKFDKIEITLPVSYNL